MWGSIASAAFSNPTSATGECDWLTLHRRMRHVALPILQQLVKEEMVADIRVKGELTEVLSCPTCIQAKFTRFLFSSSEATAKAPLDEVVMDVVGPLKLGAGGAEYFLTIMDVYTRMTWVYVLSKKSDVAETVKTDWLLMVERQQDRLVKLTYDAPGKQGKSALAEAVMMVGDDEESNYEECAFVFFSPVEMPGEPATLKEALESSDAEEWKKAMESELKSIEENDTWKLVELPEGRKAITSKWLFKIKSNADGKIERYKSRLVAKGYQQKEKVDFKELLAPVQRSFMVVYVDDIVIFSPSSDLMKEVMLKLQDKFKYKALGDVNFYLGLHIERDVEKRCMRVHQRKYLEGPEEESVGEEERRRFHSLVGRLIYAAINTRPDVAFATGQLARVVQCPNEEQVASGMRVAKYLGQTPTVGLQYSTATQRHQKGAGGVEPGRLSLTAFLDASYASEPEDMTSVGGFICCVGGGPTAWERKKQVDQALSSVESEYMALFRAVQEIVWQRRLLVELREEKQGPTLLYCDSQGAIALAKNPVLHGLTKHMRVKWHWTRSMVAAGEVELRYVKTTGQPADMMTKRLVEQQH
ncbi:unnamed protein product [Closterium sp. NIES-53]